MPLLNRSYGGKLEFGIGRKSLVDFTIILYRFLVKKFVC